MWGTILMIISFVGLVVIHEGGHMIAAKRMKVKVKEFGIGLPPRLIRIGTDKSGTQYTINLLPLGGFVRLDGDNPTIAKNFTKSGSYHSTPRGSKIIILIAGIVMNIFTARLIFTGVLSVGSQPLAILPDNTQLQSYFMPTESRAQEQGILTLDTEYPARISFIQSGSWAEKETLEIDAIITHIDTQVVYAHNLTESLQMLCHDKACDITRQPPSKTLPETASYQCTEHCLLGVVIDTEGMISIDPLQLSVGDAMIAAAQEIKTQSLYTFQTLGTLIQTLRNGSATDKQEAGASLSGPVGIVGIGGSIISQHARSQRWILIGMISLALGLFNILPIPALDGGRILGVVIQTISRTAPQKFYPKEGIINTLTMILLLGLGVIIMAKDAAQIYCRDNAITNIVFGESIQCVEESP